MSDYLAEELRGARERITHVQELSSAEIVPAEIRNALNSICENQRIGMSAMLGTYHRIVELERDSKLSVQSQQEIIKKLSDLSTWRETIDREKLLDSVKELDSWKEEYEKDRQERVKREQDRERTLKYWGRFVIGVLITIVLTDIMAALTRPKPTTTVISGSLPTTMSGRITLSSPASTPALKGPSGTHKP